MRLETIRMTGFKSFVDPTVLHLPANLSGIVGPNGCGKSNIIDAVRWVMGESAASRLRGDSLTDVIFAGSSVRKPVGQATVELIFDNSDGTIGGEYANFGQISVKRTVSRDGNSQYFLNGSRCRRRDITDLFLGTGLGARSYSIIEQGMISQIIEAHPEQLRAHLEEAAGISRYRERRKETENRIASTRENISRINDIREEVEKQLDRLTRQARTAERWQKLKGELNVRRGELHAIEFRQIRGELEQHAAGLREAQLGIDRELAEQRRLEAALEVARTEREAAAAGLNKVQTEGFRIGADIARIEQQIRHVRELHERLGKAAEDAAQAHAALSQQAEGDARQVAELESGLAAGAPAAQALAEAEQAASARLDACEQELGAWQQRWQEYGAENAAAVQATEVERTRLDYLDRQEASIAERLRVLGEERAGIDLGSLEEALAALARNHAEAQEALAARDGELVERRRQHEALVAEERRLGERLAEARAELSAGRGRLASLEALQSAALGHDQEAATTWLREHDLEGAKRVGQVLEVNPGWENAVETVLRGIIEGVLTEDALAGAETLAGVREHDLALVDARAGAPVTDPDLLAAQVRGPAAVLDLLRVVHCAADPAAARRLAADLPAGHSVVTPEGVWLAAGMARVLRGAGRKTGVLAREREIQALSARMDALAQETEQLQGERTARAEALANAVRELESAQAAANAAHRHAAELAGDLASRRGQLEAAGERLARVTGELDSLGPQQQELGAQNREARSRLEEAIARMQSCETRRGELEGQRRGLLEAREEARLGLREAGEQRQREAISQETRRSTLESLLRGIERTHEQLARLDDRRRDIADQLAEGDAPVAQLEAERQGCLEQRLQADRDLVAARRTLEEQDEGMRGLEQQRGEAEQRVAEQREAHAERRLAEQALRLRGEQLAGVIREAGLDVEALLAELDAEATVESWQARVENLEQRITRMEPVNLAAIQEHQEQAERKQYLDAQLEDLTTALATLEDAIRKIDRETRARFRETFEKVNTGLQELFPRLFGGGQAYLELTGEDLLSAGVSIMVRPPGKRISNISLLSGGEKAVTAVALVFAIFQLNPAPFCILDEVDAPMDEANVGRFNAMLREMSGKVQFIIVTHNKNTMEATDQLCGVTMREPGVSRLVSVDVAEAARLAGAA